MPPTRMVRYCCSVLKETGCQNRYIATGVRWDESNKRAERGEFEKLGKSYNENETFSTIMLMNDNGSKRRMGELCMQQNKMVVNPIIDWTHSDIWQYIESEHIEVCDLYKCGYDRVGCIGCPMASKKRYKEFADFPEYKKLYIHAFDRMLEERKRRGKECKWKSGEEVFLWWMEDENIPGQMSIEDFYRGQRSTVLSAVAPTSNLFSPLLYIHSNREKLTTVYVKRFKRFLLDSSCFTKGNFLDFAWMIKSPFSFERLSLAP